MPRSTTGGDLLGQFEVGVGALLPPFQLDLLRVQPVRVEIETEAPYPILPDVISNVYIMSKKWAETNQATRPVDRRKGVENAASFRANGTGPFRLRERQPNVRTTFVMTM